MRNTKFQKFIGILLALVTCMLFAMSAFAFSPEEQFNAVMATEEKSSDLNRYVEVVQNKNQMIMQTDMEDIVTTITFSKYLSFEELKDYLRLYDLKPMRLYLRGFEADGTRVTIFTKTDLGLEATESLIEDEAKTLGYDLEGITGIYTLVDSEKLAILNSDSCTYFADTSGDQASLTNQEISGIKRNNVNIEKDVSLFPQPLTWEIEDAGILTK